MAIALIVGMGASNELRDGIDQVREILVGAVQRDLERRLGRIEAHLSARMAEVQQEARRRTDVIEAHLRREVDTISSRFEAELTELRDSLRATSRDHRETISATEQRLGKLEESVVRAQHDLRKEILDQAKGFLDEIHRTREELGATLERELGALEIEPAEAREAGEERGSESAH
jgi:hypothetical protein